MIDENESAPVRIFSCVWQWLHNFYFRVHYSIAWNISYNHEKPSAHCCCWRPHRENFVNNDVHEVHVLRDVYLFHWIVSNCSCLFHILFSSLECTLLLLECFYLERSLTTMITLEDYKYATVICWRLMVSLLFVLLKTGVMDIVVTICFAHLLSVHYCCRRTMSLYLVGNDEHLILMIELLFVLHDC